MAKIEIVLDVNPKVKKYLRDLVKTGLYGGSVEEAAERLISRGIEAEMKDWKRKAARGKENVRR